MSSGYIIANVTVTDPQQYEQYKKWSSAAIQAHGAEVCVRGGSVEAPRRLNDSPGYGRARASRQGAAVMRMLLVEGV